MNDDGDRVYTMKVSKEDRTRLRLAGDPWLLLLFFIHGIIQLIGMEVCVLLLDVCVCHLWHMYGVAVYVPSELPTTKTQKMRVANLKMSEKMSVYRL